MKVYLDSLHSKTYLDMSPGLTFRWAHFIGRSDKKYACKFCGNEHWVPQWNWDAYHGAKEDFREILGDTADLAQKEWNSICYNAKLYEDRVIKERGLHCSTVKR